MIGAGTSAGDAIREIAAALATAGIDSPRLDARLLVEAATGLSREQLVLDPGRLLSAHDSVRLDALTRRRLAREPVTRLVGSRSFFGREFEVTADTLDPRPETETLVELALALAREDGLDRKPATILDIGTGTGCILLTLIAEIGETARGVGIDVSTAALGVARRNSERLGIGARVSWEAIGAINDISVAADMVVSNPPYIPSADIAGLEPEVRSYDPMLALDGGPDGLAIIRQIVTWSSQRPQTWFAIEIGAGQDGAVLDIVERCCGTDTRRCARVQDDLGGHIRCVAWKPQI